MEMLLFIKAVFSHAIVLEYKLFFKETAEECVFTAVYPTLS